MDKGIEVFKVIPEYEDYLISNWGRVKSFDNYRRCRGGKLRLCKGKILKSHEDGNKYLQIMLYKNKMRKHLKLHRLVAQMFLPPPLPEQTDVNHKDENKHNNFVYINPDGTVDLDKSNLEWVSHIENCNYGSRNQRVSESKINHPSYSKRVAQYTLDGELVAIYPSTREAARQTGFCHQNISACCLGKQKTAYGYIWKFIE